MHFEQAVNTKHENKREMTINLPNLFDRNIYLRVLEMVFQGVQVAKISGDPLVFSGFALDWPHSGQESGRGAVQRLDTLQVNLIFIYSTRELVYLLTY